MGMADLQFPVELLLEILLRLPVKSLGRFVCVSKFWERVIRSDDFSRWFSSRSSPEKQPRFLMAFNNEIKGYYENWHFYSKSTLVSVPGVTSKFSNLWRDSDMADPTGEEEPPEFLSSTVCQLKKLRYQKPSYAHGLISFLYGEEQVVCNPTTGKSVTLPSVESTEMTVRSFLGYDPISAQYKVLCLTNVTRFCEHQVLTLSSAQTQSCSWRTIQCSLPHCPLGTNSVCVDGVLYYTASASFNMKEPFLAGFGLRSESFEIASTFPEGFDSNKFHEAILIDYLGKVALATLREQEGYTFTLWVLEDAKKQEWSKECLYFCPRDGTGRFYNYLGMVGASGTGEFLYAPFRFEELYVYFVDHKTNLLRSVQLQGNTTHKFRDFYQAVVNYIGL